MKDQYGNTICLCQDCGKDVTYLPCHALNKTTAVCLECRDKHGKTPAQNGRSGTSKHIPVMRSYKNEVTK